MSETKITAPKLGRGLESLIPKSYLASGKTIVNIPLSDIETNPYQPRLYFDEEALLSLSHSIKTHGLAQPILVRRKGRAYELVAGERRYRACMMAGLSVVPGIVREMSDKESLKIALIENLDRENLNPIEEAKGYQRLIVEFDMSHQDIGHMFTKSRSAVSNLLRLLKLPDSIQQSVARGEISEGHARTLLSFKDEAEMLAQLKRIKEEGLNVREAEAMLPKDSKKSKSKKAKGQLGLFSQFESELSEQYKAPFKIKGSRSRGKIEISFNSKDQFEALYAALNSVTSKSK